MSQQTEETGQAPESLSAIAKLEQFVNKLKAVVATLTEQKARAEDRLDYESRLGSLLAYCEEKGRAEALGEAIELLEAVMLEAVT